MLVSFPPLSYMLKSSGSSYQFEARLGGRHMSVNPRFILADDYNRPLLRYLPQPTCPVNDRCCLATTYHAGKQTVRCTGICAVRLFTSGDTDTLCFTARRVAGTAQASVVCNRAAQLNGKQAQDKTPRVRTTGTQTGMLPGISRKRNVRSKF